MIVVIVPDPHDECILVLQGLNEPGPFAPWGFRSAETDFVRQRSQVFYTTKSNQQKQTTRTVGETRALEIPRVNNSQLNKSFDEL